MIRRVIPFALILSLLSAICPAPALALSTQQEIEMGRQYDQGVVEQNVVETDPLLNAWVQSVANKLWAQTVRKDIPYNVKILRETDYNAFSTLGGYVYVNEGMLDFVQSDDELAAVLGHETGHIERRHVVMQQNHSQIINLLLTVASLFSPLIYNFGNLIQAGAIAKMERVDELQGDQYGLMLMSRAGYDPQAMVSMLNHLGAAEHQHDDLISKYLESHPGTDARISHLLGYDELDPTKVTNQQKLVEALHDLDEARYNIASLELGDVLKKDPSNEEALLGLGQAELALGQTGKSQQTLGELAQSTSPRVKAAAAQSMAALRAMEIRRVDLAKPNLAGLRDELKNADQVQSQALSEVSSRHDQGHSQLRSLQQRLQTIQYELPDLSQIQIKPHSRLETISKNINGMTRSVNSAIEDLTAAIDQVGTVDAKTGKTTGMLRENADILNDMEAPLKSTPMPSDSIAIFPSYPHVLSEVAAADGDMEHAVDAGRAAGMQLDQGLGDLDAFLKRLQQVQVNQFGDLNEFDYSGLVPSMQQAVTSLGAAAVSASQSNQLYNMARARQLSARITMLGLGATPQRYDTLRKAINVRFSNDDLDFLTMLHDNATPGDIAAASIVAAEFKTTPQAILREAHESHRDIVDLANAKGMSAESLEIFMGLLYLDYTDDPVKEAHPDGSGATGNMTL